MIVSSRAKRRAEFCSRQRGMAFAAHGVKVGQRHWQRRTEEGRCSFESIIVSAVGYLSFVGNTCSGNSLGERPATGLR